MPKGLDDRELGDVKERSRRLGREAGDRAPFSTSPPPGDIRPLGGLPLPRGLLTEDLTSLEIQAITEAWIAGYREGMDHREAAGAQEEPGPTIWWSPAVPGGWREGWRYRDPGATGAARTGPLRGSEHLDQDAPDGELRRLAGDGGTPTREGADWSAARIERRRDE